MQCKICGNHLEPNANFCGSCGIRVDDPIMTDSNKNENSGKKNKKATVAIIVLSVIVLVLVAAIAIFVYSYLSQKDAKSDVDSDNEIISEEYTQDDSNTEQTDQVTISSVQIVNESKVVIAYGGLRIRDIPDIENGEKVGLIPNGTKITITKIVDEWAFTTYNNVSGWCSTEFLYEPTEYNGTSIYTAKVKPESGIKLRSDSYISESTEITTVEHDETLQVYEITGDWAYVSYKAIYGWCLVEYLEY